LANNNARNIDGNSGLTLPIIRSSGNTTPRNNGKGNKNRDATPRNPIYGALSGLTPANSTPKGKGKSGKGKRQNVKNAVFEAANDAMSPAKRSVYASFASTLSEDRGTKANLKIHTSGASFDPFAQPGEAAEDNSETTHLLENDPFQGHHQDSASERLAQFGASVSGSENEAQPLKLILEPLALNLKDAQTIEDASTRCGTTHHHGGLSTSAGPSVDDSSVTTDRATEVFLMSQKPAFL
jgi:hypothetical protein